MNMIERVAAAIRKRRENYPDPMEFENPDAVYDGMAKAAIKAMREPTPEIYQAINNHNADQWFDPEDLWTGAIDAALTEVSN